jgi:hypothetical protein
MSAEGNSFAHHHPISSRRWPSLRLELRMPHRVPFTGESERRFDARQAATVASLTKRSHDATPAIAAHRDRSSSPQATPSDELPTMRRLGSWWRHVHAAGRQDRDAYTRPVRTRMTLLCPSAVPYAFARFLPPEPNIRTLKRGGGEKT